jgi:hypothetical protein
MRPGCGIGGGARGQSVRRHRQRSCREGQDAIRVRPGFRQAAPPGTGEKACETEGLAKHAAIMRTLRPAFLIAAICFLAASANAQAETRTLHYPTQEETMFSIDAPGDWKVTEIAEVGDFGSLESASGSVLQFRAVECNSEEDATAEIDAIFDSTAEFLAENYTDIQLDDPKEVDVEGQPGAQLAGTGQDKNGDSIIFLSAMIALGPTTVAEIWAAAYAEDVPSAQAVLHSFKPTGSSGE